MFVVEEFNFVFLDIYMLEISGLDFLEWMKNELVVFFKVIVVFVNNDLMLKDKCYVMGCYEFFDKFIFVYGMIEYFF